MRSVLPEKWLTVLIFMDGGYIVEEGTPQEVILNPKRRTISFLE